MNLCGFKIPLQLQLFEQWSRRTLLAAHLTHEFATVLPCAKVSVESKALCDLVG